MGETMTARTVLGGLALAAALLALCVLAGVVAQ